MRDEDKNYRTIKQIIKDSTDRELERYETKGLTPDELKTMVAAAKRKKKQRYRKLAGVAALFVVVLFGAIIVFNNFSTDVEADKNAKEEIITEDGVVIEDGGWGSSLENNWLITDWSEIDTAKSVVSDLVIPEYIPKGYEFKSLEIEEMENAIKVEYIFFNLKKELIINQYMQDENLETTTVYDNSRQINSNKGKVYIKENQEKNEAIIIFHDSFIIDIWYDLSDEEIIRIIDNIN